MSRIFITGDVHNSIDVTKLSTKNFPEQKELNREDIVIVAGDFGFPWVYGESPEDAYWLDWFTERNYTLVFADGNHENFDALYEYPETVFRGAKCHQLRENVFHVKRGEVLEIGKHKILFMGGAESVDKAYRREFTSWWSQEIPTKEEWDNCFENVSKANIIVSHDCPTSVTDIIYEGHDNSPFSVTYRKPPSTVNRMFEELLYKIKEENIPIKNWFFGHHHRNQVINYEGIEFNLLYKEILELKEK